MARVLRRFTLFPAFALVAAWSLLGTPAKASDLCDADDDRSGIHVSDRGKTVYDLQEIHQPAPRGVWKIDGGENGSVSIMDWDKDEVLICAKVSAWAKDTRAAESLLRSIHVESGGGALRAEGPAQSRSKIWAVSYRIYAPRQINLNVQTINGGVSIDGVRGRMTLSSQNGPIQVTDAGGDVRGRTTNGPVSATLTGSRWRGEGLDLETVNGPVSLSIPTRYSAELTTGTENGPMDISFPVTDQGRMRHRITTTLGSGGPPVRVLTTNGPLVVQRTGRD